MSEFENKLKLLLDNYSECGNSTNDPDAILAKYLIQCIETFKVITKRKN